MMKHKVDSDSQREGSAKRAKSMLREQLKTIALESGREDAKAAFDTFMASDDDSSGSEDEGNPVVERSSRNSSQRTKNKDSKPKSDSIANGTALLSHALNSNEESSPEDYDEDGADAMMAFLCQDLKEDEEDHEEDSNDDSPVLVRSTHILLVASVEYRGQQLTRNSCYTIPNEAEGVTTWGIKHFTSGDKAVCVPVVEYFQTFQGCLQKRNEPDLPAPKDLEHVQIPSMEKSIALAAIVKFGTKVEGLVLPQVGIDPRKGMNHALVDLTPKVKDGKRAFEALAGGNRESRAAMVDLFGGAGFASQGAKEAGLRVKVGVESDPNASRAYYTNHCTSKTQSFNEKEFEEFAANCKCGDFVMKLMKEGDDEAIFCGTVQDFLAKYKQDKSIHEAYGEIAHVHLSPPCRAGSSARQDWHQRSAEAKRRDEEINSLMLLMVEVAKIIGPLTISLENVCGLWRNDPEHKFIDDLLYKIYVGLWDAGYHYCQGKMRDCDYGGNQIRSRLIILAAKRHVPLPRIPPKTHCHPDPQGAPIDPSLEVYRKVEDCLGPFENKYKHLERGEFLQGDEKYCLEKGKPSPTIRASKMPKHYNQNRFIHWEEALVLTCGRSDFYVHGSKKDKERQIGNAVPTGIATIFRVMASIHEYIYKDPAQLKKADVDGMDQSQD